MTNHQDIQLGDQVESLLDNQVESRQISLVTHLLVSPVTCHQDNQVISHLDVLLANQVISRLDVLLANQVISRLDILLVNQAISRLDILQVNQLRNHQVSQLRNHQGNRLVSQAPNQLVNPQHFPVDILVDIRVESQQSIPLGNQLSSLQMGLVDNQVGFRLASPR